MVSLASRFVAAALAALTVSTAGLGQSYYDDQACRQFADAQTAPLRDQANSQAIGSTLLGAGLGAAFGAAVGGGRGAGIGAASGAIVGTGVGAANAQNAAGYLQQQYNAYYIGPYLPIACGLKVGLALENDHLLAHARPMFSASV